MQDPRTIYSSKAWANSFQVTLCYSQWGYPVMNIEDKKKIKIMGVCIGRNSFQIHENAGMMSGSGRHTLPLEHTPPSLNNIPITVIYPVSRI